MHADNRLRQVLRQPRSPAMAIAIAVALSTTSGVHAEVIDSDTNGFTLRNSGTAAAPPERAWQALVDDVGRWWPAAHTWWGEPRALHIDARAGGCFCEIDGARQAAHMQIAIVDPGQRLLMLGGLGPLQGMGLHGALDWRFEAEGDSTRVILEYRVGGYSADDLASLAPIVDRVQAEQLQALLDFLDAEAAAAAIPEEF
jgi:uncharacterized protein YndB with AHSA1/START domain